MKKLLEKDKKLRLNLKKIDKKYFVLKSIFKNLNFFVLIRWNAFIKLKALSNKNSKISISHKCLSTVNKKRFNKLTNFSRHVFLKLIRSGDLPGSTKASW